MFAQSPLKHKQFAFKASAVNEDGTFAGYGSVFGNVDSYREIVAPGAFTQSLEAIKSAGDPLPALWQHNQDQPIGGYNALEQDAQGLKVSGFLLVNDVPLAREAHALMKARVVKGLSIGYYVRGDTVDPKTQIRTLTNLDLQEISIVTFPANREALIDSVKSWPNVHSAIDFERMLRDVCGMPNRIAKQAARLAWPAIDNGDSDPAIEAALLRILNA